MATTVAKLKKSELNLKGKVNERLPVVQSGLIAHFPFDGKLRNVQNYFEDEHNHHKFDAWSGSGTYFSNRIQDGTLFGNPVFRCEKQGTQDAFYYYHYGVPFFPEAGEYVTFSCMAKSSTSTESYCPFGIYFGRGNPWTAGNYTAGTEIWYKKEYISNGWWKLSMCRYLPREDVVSTYRDNYYFGLNASWTNAGQYIWGACPMFYSGTANYPYCTDDSELDASGVITNEGLELSENTTNIVENVGFNDVVGNYAPAWDTSLHPNALNVTYWSDGYNGGVSSPETGYHAQWVYEGRDGKPCMKFIDRNDIYDLGHRWLGISNSLGTPSSLGWSVGDEITISLWQKSSILGKGCSFGIYHMRLSEGSYGFEDTKQTHYVEKLGEWERVSHTFTITSNWDLSASCTFYCYGHYGNHGILWVEGCQAEKKSYATALADGIEGERHTYQLPIDLVRNTEGTISFKFRYTSLLNWQRIFRVGTYTNPITEDCMILLVDGTDLETNGYKKVYTHMRSNASQLDTNCGNEKELYKDTWYDITYTWSMANQRATIYVDGEIASQKNMPIGYTMPTFDNFTYWTLGNTTNHGNLQYRDLSIYSRELSQNEIKKNINSSFTLTKDGDLVTPKIVEKPMIPSDSMYFPLAHDAKDEHKYTNPTTETNIAYENGAMWVGEETTNLWSGLTYSWTSGVGVVTRNSTKDGLRPDLEVVKLESTDGNAFKSIPWKTDAVIETPGQIYTHSVYAYLESGTYVGIGQHWNPWDYSTSHKSYIPKGEWVRIDTTITTNHESNTTVALEYCTDGVAYFTAPQYEKKSYRTPFTPSTRGKTHVDFPYDIIDCKQDFTVFGFWYPKVYADGIYRPCLSRERYASNSTYNRILIMGNGTSSYQLRCWHGSDSVSESSCYAPSSIPVIENEWNFFVLKREGTNMILGIGNSGGFGMGTATATAYKLDEDEDTTNWGWIIGQYANSHTSNAYHKDYGFVQRALTDEEIENIFKTHMRQYSDKLQVLSKVNEGFGDGLSANTTVGGIKAVTKADVPFKFRENGNLFEYSSEGIIWTSI